MSSRAKALATATLQGVEAAATAASVPASLVVPLVEAGVSIDDAVAVTAARLQAFPASRTGPVARQMLKADRALLAAGLPAGTLIGWVESPEQGRVTDAALRALDLGASVDELVALPVTHAQNVIMHFNHAVDSGWTTATLTGVARLSAAHVGGSEVFAVLQAGYPVDDLVALADAGVDLRWQQWPVPITEPISADPDARRLVLLLISVHEVTHAAATLIADLLPRESLATMTRFLIDGMPLTDAAKAAAAIDAPVPASPVVVTRAAAPGAPPARTPRTRGR
jgi:hypothetical protein